MKFDYILKNITYLEKWVESAFPKVYTFQNIQIRSNTVKTKKLCRRWVSSRSWQTSENFNGQFFIVLMSNVQWLFFECPDLSWSFRLSFVFPKFCSLNPINNIWFCIHCKSFKSIERENFEQNHLSLHYIKFIYLFTLKKFNWLNKILK